MSCVHAMLRPLTTAVATVAAAVAAVAVVMKVLGESLDKPHLGPPTQRELGHGLAKLRKVGSRLAQDGEKHV